MVAIDVVSENKFASLFIIVLFTSVVCVVCCETSVLSGEDAPVLCVGVTGDSVSIYTSKQQQQQQQQQLT